MQAKLAVPKGRENTFGGFSYRNAEDILRAVKPLLAEYSLLVTLTDSIEMLGNRFYVASTASLIDAETGEEIAVQAMAREPDERKKWTMPKSRAAAAVMPANTRFAAYLR